MEGKFIILALMVGCWCIQRSEGRGMLFEPPARSSMWRHGFKTPINYNDNGLNCGGMVKQWTYNQGKCGVCGDPYDGVRDNERGGRFVTDLVARTYRQGQIIPVTVVITANERGWFQFHLCPSNDSKTPVNEKCLQEHLLQFADGSTKFYLNPNVIGNVNMQVKLPPGITCDRCVFRWKWNAGNGWGMDANGKSCLGCGVQEQFYGCSDVAILPQAQSLPVPQPTIQTTTKLSTHSPTSTGTTDAPVDITDSPTTLSSPSPSPSSSLPSTVEKITKAKSTDATSTARPKVKSTTAKPKPTTKEPTKVRCKAINDWLGIPVFDQWCEINCSDLNICLSTNCLCTV